MPRLLRKLTVHAESAARTAALGAAVLLALAPGCRTAPVDAAQRGSSATGSSATASGTELRASDAARRPTTPIAPAIAEETFEVAWTTVRDTHYDPTFGGVDWEQVYVEFRPRAAAADSKEELRVVLQSMLERLGQSHFAILPGEDGAEPERIAAGSAGDRRGSGAPGSATSAGGASAAGSSSEPESSGEPGTLGLAVRVVDGQAVVVAVEEGSPAARAGVAPGWIVERVDGDEVALRLDRVASMPEGPWRTYVTHALANELLATDRGASTAIEFRDGSGARLERRLVAVEPAGTVIAFGGLPPMVARTDVRMATSAELAAAGAAGADRVGIIGFTVWMVPIVRPVHEAFDRFRDADGIVIDLRGNPGGIGALSMGIAGHFNATSESLGRMRARDGEIQFLVNPRRTSLSGELVEPFAGPVAILVDELSASTSEIFAGGLQALGRVRVFGRTTAGAALPAAMTRLPSGDTLLHAIADFTTSDGTRLEGRGVVPDEIVALDRADLLAGRDAALLAALAWIAREQADSESLHSSARERATPFRALTMMHALDRSFTSDTSRPLPRAGLRLFAAPLLAIAMTTPLVAAAPPAQATPPTRPRPTEPIAPPNFAPGGANDAKPADAAAPSPQELVDAYIKAIGGAEKLSKHTSRRVTARFEMGGLGAMSADATIAQRTPNLMLSVIEIPGMGTMKQGFDGTNGWSNDPMRGPILLSGAELEQMRREAIFQKELKLLEQYESSRTVGSETFAGQPVWKVELKDKDGNVTNAFFNKETGLLAGMSTTVQMMGGEVPSTTTFVEYKEFDGIKLAALTEIVVMGQKQTLRVEKVEFDVLEATDFAPPADVQALIDAAKKSAKPADPPAEKK